MDNINLTIKRFEAQLVATVNSSPLPLEVKRLAMFEVMNQLSKTADEQIKAEIEAEKEEQNDNADI